MELTTTIIYLLRHGETEWNHDGNRYCGMTDVPLSSHGYEQAGKAKHAMRNIPLSEVFCSTLSRSSETARIVAEAHQLKTIRDGRLVEIDFGLWEGQTRSELEANDASAWQGWLADPSHVHAGHNGETATGVYARAEAFMAEIGCTSQASTSNGSTSPVFSGREAESQTAARQQRHIAIIGHNTFNRIFVAGALGVPFKLYRKFVHDNAAITTLEWSPTGWRLLHMNDISHLR
jgi:broad specificity phosphatase PhoE